MKNNYFLEKCYSLQECLEIYINLTSSECASALLREVNDEVTNLELEEE